MATLEHFEIIQSFLVVVFILVLFVVTCEKIVVDELFPTSVLNIELELTLDVDEDKTVVYNLCLQIA